jgi:hypothetical protein
MIDEKQLVTCRIKFGLEKLVDPLLKVLGYLIMSLVVGAWLFLSGISILAYVQGDKISVSLIIMTCLFDGMALILSSLPATMESKMWIKIPSCAIMLTAIVMLSIKAAIIDGVAAGLHGSLSTYVILALANIIAYLILIYAAAICLCEFEKIIRKAPRMLNL